ncbi:hypothetical protein [Pseudothauera rhizosphaerae]|uniref:Uncharacterized protein n=1 Tax=Pseudothauera rhizosphaerae TaxID=2565932 RepID=A0A4S4ABB6_9RHOO|nr:hypothetical protein [Pseudothauera rhizosphaerae]THF55923.1 hypothetical protein E6O51_20265 [Pseudothauera rhizosphaerae]
MSTERTEQLIRVGLMDEAERFLKTNLGRHLVDRAEAERDAAMAELKEADAENPKYIRELQNRIYRAESFQFWLAELITEGRNALHEMQENAQQ